MRNDVAMIKENQPRWRETELFWINYFFEGNEPIISLWHNSRPKKTNPPARPVPLLRTAPENFHRLEQWSHTVGPVKNEETNPNQIHVIPA
jgi:hypothetical protein